MCPSINFSSFAIPLVDILPSSPTVALFIRGLVASLLLAVWYSRRPCRPYPPGPTGLPIVGSIFRMPLERQWLTFTAWGKQYGPIVHVSVLGKHYVILNTARAVADLFNKRGAIYSNRPRLPMAGELVGYGESVPLCNYSDRLRTMRKLVSETLAQRKGHELYPVHEEKVRAFLYDLLESPSQFRDHVRLAVARIVFQISHGYTVYNTQDPLMMLAERAVGEFGIAMSPGKFLVDSFPMLQYVPEWFPGAGFKRKAKEWRANMIKIRDVPFELVKSQLSAGTARPSFTTRLIERYPTPTPEEENMIKWVTGNFYSAGTETTVSVIDAFLLAMTLHPDVQSKAQAEIDAVVRSSRLPNFDDRDKLPYLEAIMREVYRWNPVGNLAIPHELEQDDIYEGYFLPKGSVVIGNTWAILHEPTQYPAPLDFIPERYLVPDGTRLSDLPDPRLFAFGYGRRVCPGQHLADASIFLMMATTLAVFNISPALDARGVPAKPPVQFTPTLVSQPVPFECSIRPRSPLHAQLVRDSQNISE